MLSADHNRLLSFYATHWTRSIQGYISTMAASETDATGSPGTSSVASSDISAKDEKKRLYDRKWRDERRGNNICPRCQEPLIQPGNRCTLCREVDRQRAKAAREASICIRCRAKEAVSGKNQCQKCAETCREKSAARRVKLLESNLCTSCGGFREGAKNQTCDACTARRAKNRARLAKQREKAT